jgi:hypothetical protein
MAILDLFSKRQKKKRGEVADVYQYDDLPSPLRVQIVHICTDTIGNQENYEQSTGQYRTGETEKAYKLIVDALCREYGIFRLPGTKNTWERNYLDELANFVLTETDTERVLDAVELIGRVIANWTNKFNFLNRDNAEKLAQDAITELNARFAEHAVGYRYEAGEILRIDSQLIHEEVVKPALRLLSSEHYAGAQDEFLRAHAHYRKGDAKEAMNDALKAFESTLKCVCNLRNWSYPPNATSKALLEVVYTNNLVPVFWQNEMGALRALLEGGVPVGRNRLSGHGQGAETVDVPIHIASYVLHMTAAAIVFLIEAENAV